MNNTCFTGRLTAEPELKTTKGGVSVTSFSIAVDRTVKDKDGKYITDFIPVVAWRNTAEFVCKYFGKGQMIAVVGELQSRRYEDKNGGKHTALEVIASQVGFCGDSKKANASAAPDAAPHLEALAEEDDLPF